MIASILWLEEKEILPTWGGSYAWFRMDRVTKQTSSNMNMNMPTKKGEAVNLDEKIPSTKRNLAPIDTAKPIFKANITMREITISLDQ